MPFQMPGQGLIRKAHVAIASSRSEWCVRVQRHDFHAGYGVKRRGNHSASEDELPAIHITSVVARLDNEIPLLKSASGQAGVGIPEGDAR